MHMIPPGGPSLKADAPKVGFCGYTLLAGVCGAKVGVLTASVLLVVGDDEERLHLRRALSGEGWRVIPAGSGSQARQMAGREDFEIAVVDNRLPDERGFQVISAVQKPGVSTVALLRDEDTMDRIVGIELGADYYMRSPVNPRELVARVKQIFRKRERAGDGDSGRIFVGELEIDPDQVQVLRNKLGDDPTDPKLIETVRGFGYRLVRPTA